MPDKDLIVIMGTSKRGVKLMPLLEEQLQSAGVEYHVSDLPADITWQELSTVKATVNNFKNIAFEFYNYKHIISVDAWDMLFYGTKDDLLRKVPDDRVLFAAEKNMFPYDDELDKVIPDTNTKWKYVNCGAFAGNPTSFHAFADFIEFHIYGYDGMELNQAYLNRLLTHSSCPISIDSNTDLFYCYILDNGELTINHKKPYNMNTGTFPNFIHFNGGSDPIPFLEKTIQEDANNIKIKKNG